MYIHFPLLVYTALSWTFHCCWWTHTHSPFRILEPLQLVPKYLPTMSYALFELYVGRDAEGPLHLCHLSLLTPQLSTQLLNVFLQLFGGTIMPVLLHTWSIPIFPLLSSLSPPSPLPSNLTPTILSSHPLSPLSLPLSLSPPVPYPSLLSLSPLLPSPPHSYLLSLSHESLSLHLILCGV